MGAGRGKEEAWEGGERGAPPPCEGARREPRGKRRRGRGAREERKDKELEESRRQRRARSRDQQEADALDGAEAEVPGRGCGESAQREVEASEGGCREEGSEGAERAGARARAKERAS